MKKAWKRWEGVSVGSKPIELGSRVIILYFTGRKVRLTSKKAWKRCESVKARGRRARKDIAKRQGDFTIFWRRKVGLTLKKA